MTTEEMRSEIEKYCDVKEFCEGCPLRNIDVNSCYSCCDEETVKKHYELIFGKHDSVNHPSHYQGKHECIDEMIHLFGVDAVIGFCKCNVYKYRYRADRKNGAEDLEKAEWYMDKLIELERMVDNDGT